MLVMAISRCHGHFMVCATNQAWALGGSGKGNQMVSMKFEINFCASVQAVYDDSYMQLPKTQLCLLTNILEPNLILLYLQ